MPKPSFDKAIIAYIAPIGSELTMVNKAFKRILKGYNVRVRSFSISDQFEGWLEEAKPKDKNKKKRKEKVLKNLKKGKKIIHLNTWKPKSMREI